MAKVDSFPIQLRSVLRDCEELSTECENIMSREVNTRRSELLFDCKNLLSDVCRLSTEISEMLNKKKERTANFEEQNNNLDKMMAKLL